MLTSIDETLGSKETQFCFPEELPLSLHLALESRETVVSFHYILHYIVEQ